MALSLLVVIHEFGHFLFARIFGVKVEKFYIFFNPVTSLFKWKPKKYAGSLGRIKYFTEEAKKEGEADAEFLKAEADYEKAYAELEEARPSSRLKRMFKTEDPEKIAKAEKAVADAETELAKHIKVRVARDNDDYQTQKKESRLKRFWGHTEYGIGWLPLGGYCKLGGMIDE